MGQLLFEERNVKPFKDFLCFTLLTERYKGQLQFEARNVKLFKDFSCFTLLTLLHSKQPKLHRVLAVLSAVGLTV